VTTVEFCNGTVKLTIQDNGRGFQPPGQARELVEVGKLGLTGMVERAELAGGTLTVHSGPGQGTKVQAEIPV
jgi:signal transduction histidine kinase